MEQIGDLPASAETAEREKVGERVTLYRRGSVWQAGYNIEGKQYRVSLKTSNKKQAARKAIKIEADLLGGNHTPQRLAPLLEEVVKDYKAYLQTKGVRPSTIKRYNAELDRFIEFARTEQILRITGITKTYFDRYREYRTPLVEAATLYHESTLLKQVVNFAVRRGWLRSNPLKDEKLKKPKWGEQPCFTQDQVEALVAKARPPYKDLFILLAFTGMRINEAIHLTWSDVDFEGGFIWIRAKDGWMPKDGDNRKVPLHPRIRPVLEALRKEKGLVFTGKPSKHHPNGGQPLADRRALQALKTAMKRAGMTEGKLHSFRHAFVSMCANNGIPPMVVASWTGHSTLEMVLRYYNLSDEESLRMIQRLPGKAEGGKELSTSTAQAAAKEEKR